MLKTFDSAPKEAQTQSDIVVASTLFLFSSYARGKPNANLKNILLRHLSILADDQALSPVIRGVCEQLEQDWQNLPAPALFTPTKENRAKSPLVWLFGRK
jgi:hypothetical protein